MKDLKELLSREDANIFLPEIINKVIIEEMKANLVGRNLVQTINLSNGSSIKFPKAHSTAVAYVVPEAGEIPVIQGETYSEVIVTPYKVGIRAKITKELIEDGSIDVMKRNIHEATHAIIQKEDTDIFNALRATTRTQSSVGAWSTASNILKDVSNVMELLEVNEYRPQVFVMHPSLAASIRSADLFDKTKHYSGDAVQSRGIVGSIFTIPVYITTVLPATELLCIDTRHAGVLVVRRPLTVENFVDISRDMEGVAMTTRYAPALLVEKACAKITGISR